MVTCSEQNSLFMSVNTICLLILILTFWNVVNQALRLAISNMSVFKMWDSTSRGWIIDFITSCQKKHFLKKSLASKCGILSQWGSGGYPKYNKFVNPLSTHLLDEE